MARHFSQMRELRVDEPAAAFRRVESAGDPA
jgi:hypothetical protein